MALVVRRSPGQLDAALTINKATQHHPVRSALPCQGTLSGLRLFSARHRRAGATNKEEQMQRSKIRKELLLSTVALIAGISVAAAQGLKEGGSGPADHGASGASSQSSPHSTGELHHQGKAQSSAEGAGNHRAGGETQRNQGRAQNEKAMSGQGGRERQEKSTSTQNNSEKKGSAARETEQR